MAEATTTLQSNYSPIKEKKRNVEKKKMMPAPCKMNEKREGVHFTFMFSIFLFLGNGISRYQ